MSLKLDSKDFLKSEYETIAKAHFDVSNRVSQFFQYLLIIYSAIFLLSTENPLTSMFFNAMNPTASINGLVPKQGSNLITTVLCISISMIGFIIMLYMCQLRNEALLYARHINGIRKIVYNHCKVDPIEVSKSSILPTQTSQPRFLDKMQFVYIVIVIAIINSLFLFMGLHETQINDWIALYNRVFSHNVMLLPSSATYYLYLLVPCFFAIHFLIYCKIARKSELGEYNYKYIIGVDIDGVIADHRIQFCNIYNKKYKKDILPEQLVALPVRYAGIGITEEEEQAVFTSFEYWDTMGAFSDAVKEIRRLRNELGYKISVFTWRDWDVFDENKGDKRVNIKKYTQTWLKRKLRLSNEELKDRGFRFNIKNISKMGFIRFIKKWIRMKSYNKKPYNSFCFELGNIESPYGMRRYRTNNRFTKSQKKAIMYFVEDNLKNALRLSNICKYVFLINHPYNQRTILPYNVIRVNNWGEITSHIRSLI